MSYLDTEEVICFAHRGGARLWPENTLVAFQGGWDAGCRWMELDVHLSRDGVVMVHHDATVDRCTDGTGLLKALTVSELKALDAAYHFTRDGKSHPYRGTGVTIPTLREVLLWNPEAFVNIEIKQADPPMIEPLWTLIEELGVHDRVLIGSADDLLVQGFRRVSGGRVPTSAGKNEITRFRVAVWARATRWLDLPYQALQVPHTWRGIPVVTERFVRVAHAHGVHVHVWTIDEPREMRQLLDMGVDALMSDLPDQLVSVARNEKRQWRPRPSG